MIYQIYFTLALELLALVSATLLLGLSNFERFSFKIFARIIAMGVILGSLFLVGITSYRLLNFNGKSDAGSEPAKKPKLQMQVMPSGPAVGGKLKDPTKFDNKPVELDLSVPQN